MQRLQMKNLQILVEIKVGIVIVDAKISYSGKLLSDSHFPTLGAGNLVVVLVVLLQEIKR